MGTVLRFGVSMHKILSYLFICVGLCIIFFALQGAYRVFTGSGSAAAWVTFADLTLPSPGGEWVLPMQPVNTVINLLLFMVFMGFWLVAGARIAGIGCQLLKNERIYEALIRLKKTDEAALKKL